MSGSLGFGAEAEMQMQKSKEVVLEEMKGIFGG